MFQVRSLISHPMETGLRRDDHGNLIPRKIINKFVCRYNGVEVFRADFHEAVAASPYVEFYLHATESGRLEFAWEEDGGEVLILPHDIVVA
jgi:sulfur-oxidizing protein SoxZ